MRRRTAALTAIIALPAASHALLADRPHSNATLNATPQQAHRCANCNTIHTTGERSIAYGKYDANGQCTNADHAARAAVDRLFANTGRSDRTRLSVNPRSTGLDVQFDASPAVVADTEFVAALETAAQIWESVINDPVEVVVSVDFVSGEAFIAAAGVTFFGLEFQSTLDAVRADASPQEAAYVNALPASAADIFFDYGIQLGILSGAELEGFGGILTNSALIPAITDQDFTGPGDADAGIVFNTDFEFDNDPSDGLTPGAVDTVYVMTHEIGHSLGFISATDNISPPSLLDLFRVGGPGTSQDPATLAEFTTVTRQLAGGADAAIDPLDAFPAIDSPSFRLSTGRGAEGDGRQASHWKDQSLLGLTNVIGVMDPTFEGGAGINTLDPISEADLLAFSLIGWDIDLPDDGTITCDDIAGPGGTVGPNNLFNLLAAFGTNNPTSDFDNDGTVGPDDLFALLSFFGQTCP